MSGGQTGPGLHQQAAVGPLPHSPVPEPGRGPLELQPAPSPGLPLAPSPGWTPQMPIVVPSLLLLLTGALGWTLDLVYPLAVLMGPAVCRPHGTEPVGEGTARPAVARGSTSFTASWQSLSN